MKDIRRHTQSQSFRRFQVLQSTSLTPWSALRDKSIQILSSILALTTELVAQVAPDQYKFDGVASGTIALHKPCTL